MNIKDLQQFAQLENERLGKLFDTTGNTEKRTLSQMVKLSEEVGELAEQVLANASMQRKGKIKTLSRAELEYEFADVLLVTMLMADLMEVDVEKSLKRKIEKINKRYK